ncbi:DUF4369 domain-containing protein [Pedobacter sp. UYP30]|uniref:DUF4369 domain-containing protein n=1 Tax=Pedobacter sp. UYP30 TaxID=1756400 RepID=UPI003399F4F5
MRFFLFIQLFFSLPLFASQLQAGGNFALSGKISGKVSKQILIGYIDSSGKRFTDSANVKQGRFKFTGNINGPTSANLGGKLPQDQWMIEIGS